MFADGMMPAAAAKLQLDELAVRESMLYAGSLVPQYAWRPSLRLGRQLLEKHLQAQDSSWRPSAMGSQGARVGIPLTHGTASAMDVIGAVVVGFRAE